MEELIKNLEEKIQDSIHFKEDPNRASWGLEIGILLTRNEAIRVVDFIKSNVESPDAKKDPYDDLIVLLDLASRGRANQAGVLAEKIKKKYRL